MLSTHSINFINKETSLTRDFFQEIINIDSTVYIKTYSRLKLPHHAFKWAWTQVISVRWVGATFLLQRKGCGFQKRALLEKIL